MLLLYEEYSYLTSLGYFLVDLLPAMFRKLVFKVILGSWGLIDRKVYFRYSGKIHIGKRCAINRGCRFFASAHTDDKKNIVIGDHVVIGPNVTIFSAGHDPLTMKLDDTYGRVTIEDDVWIGGNVTILPGITIHEGAVIGVGSVVVKDVPPFTINVENPARVVKDRRIIEEYGEV